MDFNAKDTGFIGKAVSIKTPHALAAGQNPPHGNRVHQRRIMLFHDMINKRTLNHNTIPTKTKGQALSAPGSSRAASRPRSIKGRLGIVMMTLMLCLCLSASATDYRDEILPGDNPITIYSGMPIRSSAVVGDTLYILGDSLRSYTVGDDRITTIATYADGGIPRSDIDPGEVPTILSTDGQTLYGLSCETGAFGPVIDGMIQKSVQLQWDDMIVNGKPRTVRWAVIVGQTLYCSVGRLDDPDDPEPISMQMDSFDLQTGARVQTFIETDSEICRYRNDTQLVFDQDKGLFVYDPATRDITRYLLGISGDGDDVELSIGYASNSLHYDEHEDTIYFLEAYFGEQIMPDGTKAYMDAVRIRALRDDSPPQTVAVLPVNYASSAMLAATPTHIICRVWDTIFILRR